MSELSERGKAANARAAAAAARRSAAARGEDLSMTRQQRTCVVPSVQRDDDLGRVQR